MMRKSLNRALPLGAALSAALACLAPRPVAACGGLFCNSGPNLNGSQTQLVNQAAERIIFADNGDGSVTAVIEVMYEGPADEFAWLLPVPGVPEVAVSSGQVFNELQQLTAPSYTLTTQVVGSCMQSSGVSASRSSGAAGVPFGNQVAPGTPAPAATPPPVVVVAEGNVGPYDYTVISLMQGLDDPADIAVEWLDDNGYDVGELGPDVLRPYLEEGLNLLAFKLTKGNLTGSIRPVRITYEADLPSIPIRPTAVAANDNMGVMVFMLSRGRAIPKNYKALELNEAAIDWFNPMLTYTEVVNRAADEAGGQGFVTEFSGDTGFLENAIFPTGTREQWNQFQRGDFGRGIELLRAAFSLYGAWDGFDVALREGVSPEDPELVQTAINCFNCPSTSELVVRDAEFIEALYLNVIEPVLDTHELLTSNSTITRLFTTLSADEMTLDPVFDNNNDLGDVSNQHAAMQFIECNSNVLPAAAPWRIELPQGDVVRGQGSSRVWPVPIAAQPANLRIMQLATTGQGEVVEDNRAAITERLIEAAEDFSVAQASTSNPRAGSSAGAGGEQMQGGVCSAAPGHADAGPLPYFGLALLLVASRRRRR